MKEVWKYIESDYQRCSGFLYKWNGQHRCLLHFRIILFALFGRCIGFTYMFWFRLAANKSPFQMLACYMYYRMKKHTGVDILRQTKIGYGCLLPHPSSIVLNVATIIGNNCVINKGVNIGSINLHAAVIGDNVYIGPNVCIVENVHIGNNVTIGAGAIVVKDVPDGATVVGNPAKIISYKNHSDMILHKWPL
jgi:serine O-acetyltransferase